MTIRDLFAAYALNGAHITVLSNYNKIADLHVRFDDATDDDFQRFDNIADSVIDRWYTNYNGEFIIYI